MITHYITGVEAIPGELLRFYVSSDTYPDRCYLVDLESFRFNGQCSCEAFQFHPRGNSMQQQLQAGADPNGRLRCKHISKARAYLLEEVLPAIAARELVPR